MADNSEVREVVLNGWDIMRIITAKSCLQVYLKSDGKMQLTSNGAHKAIKNVIEPITGKTYKRSMKGKEQALLDCLDILAQVDRAERV